MEWLVKMKEAIDLIEEKLNERIDIEEVAKRACSSPFHFQRMFHMLTGVTVAEYIRRRRLTLAAQELAMSSVRVLDVSLKYGYESPESFAKAFRKAHGISPSDARAHGVKLRAYPCITFHLSLKGDKEMDYRIVTKDSFPVVGKAIRVTCKDGENFRRIPQFWDECHADGTIKQLRSLCPGPDVLGICMDMNHEMEELTYVVAMEGIVTSLPNGFTVRKIPAATWAVFTSIGPLPDAIQEVWKRIFQEWFPATGYQHAGGPELEVYPPTDVSAEDHRCEIWMPVVKN